MKKKRRTLTTAQKRDLIEDRGNRCEVCGEKHPSRVLEVHHKRAVAKWRSEMGVLDFILIDKPKKPVYDRKSNLIVVCPTCHRKITAGLVKLKEKPAKRKKARRRKERLPWEMDVKPFRFRY
jgi:DNA-directed RNA polymerase subunit RPC12/RpoP